MGVCLNRDEIRLERRMEFSLFPVVYDTNIAEEPTQIHYYSPEIVWLQILEISVLWQCLTRFWVFRLLVELIFNASHEIYN